MQPLDFEKPVTDLETKIEELRVWKEKEDYANMLEASHFATVDEKLSGLKETSEQIVKILQDRKK